MADYTEPSSKALIDQFFSASTTNRFSDQIVKVVKEDDLLKITNRGGKETELVFPNVKGKAPTIN